MILNKPYLTIEQRRLALAEGVKLWIEYLVHPEGSAKFKRVQRKWIAWRHGVSDNLAMTARDLGSAAFHRTRQPDSWYDSQPD